MDHSEERFEKKLNGSNEGIPGSLPRSISLIHRPGCGILAESLSILLFNSTGDLEPC
jgi:hypothetical protein